LDLICFHTSKKEVHFENILYEKNSKNEFVHNGMTLKNKCKTLPYEKIVALYDLFKDDWVRIADDKKEYWQLMSLQQLKEISENDLFTIGSHGNTHANLEAINFEDAKKEIILSKQKLEAACNKKIEEFAFPFGKYNNLLVDFCKSLGFKRILLVDYNNVNDHYETTTRNRFVINPYIPFNHQIACLLKGSYF
ncbi:MAG TPA: polysaccharide deacetylase family protein, partial [Flavobacteriaceae bacterium]|nr:polysaccharide deacetylase family protein [Flavobacteriaceae bacterium]